MSANAQTRSEAGFTLIETLVTLFILALMAGAVVMMSPGEEQRTRQFVAEFADRMAMASEESIIVNRTHSLVVTQEGFGYERLEESGWRPAERTSPLAFRPWPSFVSYRLEGAAAQDETGRVARFDAVGGSTPLDIEVESAGTRWLVSLGGEGRAHVEQLD